VVINDFHIKSVTFAPTETDPPLVINPYMVPWVRFWSQKYLQEELNKLTTQQKQQNLNNPRNIDTEVPDFSPHH